MRNYCVIFETEATEQAYISLPSRGGVTKQVNYKKHTLAYAVPVSKFRNSSWVSEWNHRLKRIGRSLQCNCCKPYVYEAATVDEEILRAASTKQCRPSASTIKVESRHQNRDAPLAIGRSVCRDTPPGLLDICTLLEPQL